MHDFKDILDKMGEVGVVSEVVQSLAKVSGLPGARTGEMIIFETGEMGQVSALMTDLVEVLVFARTSVRVGTRVTRTGEPLKVPVGESMLGKLLDGLGRGADGEEMRDVDVTPEGITTRRKVNKPMETGVTIVDLLVPIGWGQRELVMGDRKTGKTHLILQSILTQARLGQVCIYTVVGKDKVEIKKSQEFFAKHGVAKNVITVATSSNDSLGEIFKCPYTAMTIAEYFRDKGRNVLVVFDDMTAHAKFYRELALLARRFPGRDSYPGDIFHIHSRLLERAGNFIKGAITCLPVIDTVAGDMTGYIQTNLMSMTDGHIYFDSNLYFAGRRPAVNPFLSVTRVGRQTQNHLRRVLGQEILTTLNSFDKAQSFVRFGAELGESVRQMLAKGEKIMQLFNQSQYGGMAANVQTLLAGMVLAGLWEGQDMEKIQQDYQSKPEFKKKVDEAVAGSDDLQTLAAKAKGVLV